MRKLLTCMLCPWHPKHEPCRSGKCRFQRFHQCGANDAVSGYCRTLLAHCTKLLLLVSKVFFCYGVTNTSLVGCSIQKTFYIAVFCCSSYPLNFKYLQFGDVFRRFFRCESFGATSYKLQAARKKQHETSNTTTSN